jgi:hypothetical protein
MLLVSVHFVTTTLLWKDKIMSYRDSDIGNQPDVKIYIYVTQHHEMSHLGEF